MSEMEWEGAPEVYVPRVRPWFKRALADWTRGCYPRRGRVTIVWGPFVLVWGVGLLLKSGIYALGVVVICAFYPFWVAGELVTYRHRVRRAELNVWGSYMGELYNRDVPPEAA